MAAIDAEEPRAADTAAGLRYLDTESAVGAAVEEPQRGGDQTDRAPCSGASRPSLAAAHRRRILSELRALDPGETMLMLQEIRSPELDARLQATYYGTPITYGIDDDEQVIPPTEVPTDGETLPIARSRSRSILSAARQAEQVADMLARDSDAVLSAFHSEQHKIGALLATPAGGSSLLCYGLQLLLVVVAVTIAISSAPGQATAAGLTEPTALLWVSSFLASVGWLSTILVISSARDALRDNGSLMELGAGTAMISTADATFLQRRRLLLLSLSAICVPIGAVFLGSALSGSFMLPPSAPASTRVIWVLIGIMMCTVLPVTACGWWTSMYTASCLVRDDAIDVIRFIRSMDPTTNEWDENLPAALALVDKLQSLSDGWSDGLAGLIGMSGCFSLSFFVKALDEPWLTGIDEAQGWSTGNQRYAMLGYTAIWGVLPILVAQDLANTSSFCDILMAELNEARKRFGVDSHLKLRWLETTYTQLVSKHEA
jgi:hypothetical protein